MLTYISWARRYLCRRQRKARRRRLADARQADATRRCARRDTVPKGCCEEAASASLHALPAPRCGRRRAPRIHSLLAATRSMKCMSTHPSMSIVVVSTNALAAARAEVLWVGFAFFNLTAALLRWCYRTHHSVFASFQSRPGRWVSRSTPIKALAIQSARCWSPIHLPSQSWILQTKRSLFGDWF